MFWFLEDKIQNYPIILCMLISTIAIQYYLGMLVILEFYEWLVVSNSPIVWWFMGLGTIPYN